MRSLLRKLWMVAPAPTVFGSTMFLWPAPPYLWIAVEYALAAVCVTASVAARWGPYHPPEGGGQRRPR